jgi:hypothetical protein
MTREEARRRLLSGFSDVRGSLRGRCWCPSDDDRLRAKLEGVELLDGCPQHDPETFRQSLQRVAAEARGDADHARAERQAAEHAAADPLLADLEAAVRRPEESEVPALNASAATWARVRGLQGARSVSTFDDDPPPDPPPERPPAA